MTFAFGFIFCILGVEEKKDTVIVKNPKIKRFYWKCCNLYSRKTKNSSSLVKNFFTFWSKATLKDTIIFIALFFKVEIFLRRQNIFDGIAICFWLHVQYFGRGKKRDTVILNDDFMFQIGRFYWKCWYSDLRKAKILGLCKSIFVYRFQTAICFIIHKNIF